jgi:hypothetical protein
MTAFMMQGMFNINLTTIDVAGIPFPLSTNLLSGFTGDPAYDNACDNCPVTLVLKPTAAPVSRAPQVGEDGTVVLIVPNYEINIVADDGGTPTTLLTATVVFELPITLNATGNELEPVVGTLAVNNVKVIDNPIGANEATLASTAADLFPLAAESLGGLFGAIPLPPFEGLTLNGVGSGYNVSCTGIYMSLS